MIKVYCYSILFNINSSGIDPILHEIAMQLYSDRQMKVLQLASYVMSLASVDLATERVASTVKTASRFNLKR